MTILSALVSVACPVVFDHWIGADATSGVMERGSTSTLMSPMSGLDKKWLILAANETNLGLFKISISIYFETDLKKPRTRYICSIYGQYGPICDQA